MSNYLPRQDMIVLIYREAMLVNGNIVRTKAQWIQEDG